MSQKFKLVSLRLEETLADDFKKICAMQSLIRNRILTEFIEKYVEKHKGLIKRFEK